jgi:hypothetical protein
VYFSVTSWRSNKQTLLKYMPYLYVLVLTNSDAWSSY